MKKHLISVIVPVFNNEKYVNRCIDSILNQTYENLEVILIDDGSTDGSIKICEKWSEKDKRVKVIKQKNAGTSASRNHGIKIATGDYISFVDNDDWLRPEMYEKMLEIATQKKADAVFTRFINIDEKYSRKYTNEINLSKEKLRELKYFFVKAKTKSAFLYNIACCNRVLINKNLLEKVNFDENLTHFENVLFVLNLIKNAKNIEIADDHLYNHFNPKIDNKLYDENYYKSLKNYHKKLKEFFEKNDNTLSYLADHEYIFKVIKSKINDKKFAKNMKNILKTDEIFKNHLNKENLQKLKDAGYKENLALKLAYNKHWKLLKFLCKNI